jgi:hypothetical protein
MKLVPNSAAVAKASRFPAGITGAIVSKDRGGDAVGSSCERVRDNSTHFRSACQAKLEKIMNTSSSKSLDSGAWRDLYKAALFEVDKTKLPQRIAQAEKALALRARELFQIAGDNIEEEQALDDTMYALHALRNTSQTSHCIPHRSEAT